VFQQIYKIIELIGKELIMLVRSKIIQDYKLSGIDGEVGNIKEFYFDDKYWTVRYLVANTGNWLSSRLVLISPYFLKDVDHGSEMINVDLTKNQIEKSPSIDRNIPVTRDYEVSYHGYYGTPLYWDGPNMWGANPYLLHDREKWKNENTGLTNNGNEVTPGKGSTWDSNLRSTDDVNGFKIHASDEEKTGHVDDFVIDDETWAIRYLIINTGNIFTGRKVLISPQWIDRISWDDSVVYINLTKENIKQSPEYSEESGLTRDYEASLFGYYKKTPYWSAEPVTHDYTHSQVDSQGRYTGY
jgi:hypothetical protein